MNMLALAALLGATVYMASFVSAHHATQLELQLVAGQFKGAGIVPNVLKTFNPIGTLAANYSGIVSTTGAALPATNVTGIPEILIRGTEDAEASSTSPFNPVNNSTTTFTILLIDGNYPGSDNPDGYNLHWLGNGFKVYATRDHGLVLCNTFWNPNGFDVIPYAAPSPPEGSGPHRYIFLVYAEPAGFVAPSDPARDSGVQLFDLSAYVAAAQLGDPIAGNYFTVEAGSPTVDVASTTAVNNATLPAATLSSTTQSGAHSSAGTSSGPAPATTPGTNPAPAATTGAGCKVAINTARLGVFAALGMALLV